VAALGALAKPIRGVGGFFALSLDIVVQAMHPPFAWREFILQVWFTARVSVVSAMFLTIPFSVIVALQVGIILSEIGAGDLSGAGVALSTITQTGPLITVFVIAGSAATAISADLGARTIREEIDAMRVMGIDPVRALLVPRVAALTFNATLLNAITSAVGLTSGYFFAVYLGGVNPGAFAGSMTLVTGTADIVISFLKAAIFGLAAGLIACYKGTTPSGGPQGVGNAVNETVVYTFMALVVVLVLGDAFSNEVKL
jgi:phospholipid/cholesterol/gamma-HCH transport system permease protein